MKGVGRIYQQTFVDTYSKVAFAKLYTTKTPITAADILNDKVLPFFEAHELPMLRILTDRGTEYCGRVEQHDYQLYLAINDIDHTKTKAMSPQTNGICERFHKTILNEFYQVTFRKKLYGSIEELQKDLDEWMDYYNNHRTHQGKMCCGRTPIETLAQTNGICERFHKTILNEFYQVTFRKKLYGSIEELQKDLDEWMDYYNNHRTHQGKMCCGRTPIETLEDGKSIWSEKNLAQI
ncbi:iSSod13, transposase [Vibrio cholerae]|nr:iSSod13, transposase [Vibrio cholerae]